MELNINTLIVIVQDIILISYDPLSENNGYKLFDSELKQYRKYLTEKTG